jgi:hypothetical protein
MTQLFVERLTATATASHAARVRRLLSGVADHGLDQALAGAGLASGDWCVRRLDIELRIDDRHTDAWAEERWARALVSALKQRIDAHGSDVVYYRRPAEGLADLLADLACGRTEREWAWRRLGLLGAADPGGTAPRGAACAAARRRPELALAALAEAADRVGVVALHRMLGGDGWAELAAVVAGALGVTGLPAPGTIRPETVADRAAERVAGRIVPRSRLAARFRRARVRVDAQTAGAWAVLAAAEAEPAALRGGRAGAVVSVLAAGLLVPGDPGSVSSRPRQPSPVRDDALPAGAPADDAAPDGAPPAAGPTGRDEPAATPFPRRSSEVTGPVQPACQDWPRADRQAGAAPATSAGGRPGPGTRRPASGDHGGDLDGGRDDAGPRGIQPLDVPGVGDDDRLPTSWAGLLFLLATAADAGIPDALLADEALSDRPLHWALHHLGRRLVPARPGDPVLFAFSGTVPVAHPPWPEPGQQAVAALDRHALRWALVTARRLGEPGGGGEAGPLGLVSRIAARPGGLGVWPGWVEVYLPLDGVDVAVRRAGLDVDPGWVPWLGTVVMFRYE